ncbi:MAG: AraC family transcriptional regulator [Ruminococcaceae bacterium]|nr:AraC family transcriptional regulator [Oscillospiraceae bacterium]
MCESNHLCGEAPADLQRESPRARELELIYCTGGSGTMVFDDCSLSYEEDDIIIIPPGMPHTNESAEGFTNIHINMLEPTLSVKSPTRIRADSSGFLLNAFSAAFFYYSEPAQSTAALLSAYGDLICCHLMASQSAPARSKVVEQIESAIIRNYPDCDFELDEFLRSFPFSDDYLRKLFKRETGVTPHRFLSDKRLEIAASCLSSTHTDAQNVTEVAHLCGFREPLYFSRMFKKKYGVAPSNYSLLLAEEAEAERRVEGVKIPM